MLYTKSEYIETDTGNKISRKCIIQGSQNIVLTGKTILEAGVILRGDLRRAGSGAAVVLALGKYCRIGQGCVVRPSYKTYKGVFSYYPMKIADYVTIGDNCVIEAASIGSMVQIGKNCVIGRFTIIKDCAIILDDSIIPPGTVVPSMTVFGGSPAKLVKELPESYPELLEAAARDYYANFQPRL